MITTVIFDLDNTLIFFNEEEVFKYLSTIIYQQYFHLYFNSYESFIKMYLYSLQMLNKMHEKKSLIETFLFYFGREIPVKQEEIWGKFRLFFDNEFNNFKRYMTPLPELRKIFLKIVDKKVKIVIASNPIFPLIVQYKKLEWSGIADFKFTFITHIENMHFCKPDLGFYREICDNINEKPENCLMIGNDIINDIVSTHIGMKTFLAMDKYSLENNDGFNEFISNKIIYEKKYCDNKPDYQGRIIDIFQYI